MAMLEIANSVHINIVFFVNAWGKLHEYKSHSPCSLSQFCWEILGAKCPAVLQVIELHVVKTLDLLFRPWHYALTDTSSRKWSARYKCCLAIQYVADKMADLNSQIFTDCCLWCYSSWAFFSSCSFTSLVLCILNLFQLLHFYIVLSVVLLIWHARTTWHSTNHAKRSWWPVIFRMCFYKTCVLIIWTCNVCRPNDIRQLVESNMNYMCLDLFSCSSQKQIS